MHALVELHDTSVIDKSVTREDAHSDHSPVPRSVGFDAHARWRCRVREPGGYGLEVARPAVGLPMSDTDEAIGSHREKAVDHGTSRCRIRVSRDRRWPLQRLWRPVPWAVLPRDLLVVPMPSTLFTAFLGAAVSAVATSRQGFGHPERPRGVSFAYPGTPGAPGWIARPAPGQPAEGHAPFRVVPGPCGSAPSRRAASLRCARRHAYGRGGSEVYAAHRDVNPAPGLARTVQRSPPEQGRSRRAFRAEWLGRAVAAVARRLIGRQSTRAFPLRAFARMRRQSASP